MKQFENCNPEQLATLAAIANGKLSSEYDQTVVNELAEMNLLEPVEEGFTVPIIVWSLLNKYIRENNLKL